MQSRLDSYSAIRYHITKTLNSESNCYRGNDRFARIVYQSAKMLAKYARL